MLLLPAIVAPALLGLLPAGGDATLEVVVEQPIAFSHKHHLAYFGSGEHRGAMVGMHLEALGLEEEDAPESMWACSACHEPEENSQCMGCHDLLRKSELRNRTEVRACVACHRGAWTGNAATIPGNDVCSSCHGDDTSLPATTAATAFRPEEEELLREYLRRQEDVPWIRINTMPAHVFFSHSAHLRHAAMDCVDCHGDMTQLEDPPTTVTLFSMETCVECHRETGATQDCLICHQ